MGFRFRKSKKILPGVRVNFSKKGFGVRLGGKHGGVSFGPGGSRVSASIPGTGISYSSKLGGNKCSKSTRKSTPKSAPKVTTATSPINQTERTSATPVPLRWWFFAIIVIAILGVVVNIGVDTYAALGCFVCAVVMIIISVVAIRRKIAAEQNSEQSGNDLQQ